MTFLWREESGRGGPSRRLGARNARLNPKLHSRNPTLKKLQSSVGKEWQRGRRRPLKGHDDGYVNLVGVRDLNTLGLSSSTLPFTTGGEGRDERQKDLKIMTGRCGWEPNYTREIPEESH